MYRGLRLIEIAATKVAGKGKMDHEGAMDVEATPGRLISPSAQLAGNAGPMASGGL